jgi:hypothetical protein
MSSHRLRGLIAVALTLTSTGVAAALPTGAAAQGRTHHPARHRMVRPVHHGIPQHGGGDRDADNFGGPSDGDGNV